MWPFAKSETSHASTKLKKKDFWPKRFKTHATLGHCSSVSCQIQVESNASGVGGRMRPFTCFYIQAYNDSFFPHASRHVTRWSVPKPLPRCWTRLFFTFLQQIDLCRHVFGMATPAVVPSASRFVIATPLKAGWARLSPFSLQKCNRSLVHKPRSRMTRIDAEPQHSVVLSIFIPLPTVTATKSA